jgi:hypothetical protein
LTRINVGGVLRLKIHACVRSEAWTMRRSKKGDTKVLPMTSSEVRHVVGPVTDDTISAILKSDATQEEQELAASYLRGEGSLVDDLGHPLTGKVSRLYDILLPMRSISTTSNSLRVLANSC